MARLVRVVVPGVPHHVTQRGNRRLATFFNEEDYAAYRALMAEWCGWCGVAVWAYCLMPNHVHLIVEPEQADVLRRHERTGRPLGSTLFLKRLENKLGRILRKKPPGRKPKTKKK